MYLDLFLLLFFHVKMIHWSKQTPEGFIEYEGCAVAEKTLVIYKGDVEPIQQTNKLGCQQLYPISLRTAHSFIFLILQQGTFLYNSKIEMCFCYPCKFAWFFSSINIGSIKRLFLITTNDQLATETKNR